MDEKTTFTSDKEPLFEVLKEIADGRIQLPEFQRSFIWDDEHIRSLLASISLSYPMGAIMMLENGNSDVRFKPRPIEGVELAKEMDPERYILDGQQRLTALFQSLFLDKPAVTQDSRKKVIKRWYYIDMAAALNPQADRESAIIGLPEDRKITDFRTKETKDYSTSEKEFQHLLFPFNQVFDPSDWRMKYNEYWQHERDKIKFYDTFEKTVIESFKQYPVPVIKLLKKTPKAAVCQVFEKVNTGGVILNVFQLLTATFAADGFNLREDWDGKCDSLGRKTEEGRIDTLKKHRVLRSVADTSFLQVITLLTTYARKQEKPDAPISCKKDDILNLKLEDYRKWVEPAMDGFDKAAKFLVQQTIFSDRDIPYSTQLVPLATLFAILREKANNDAVREKLIQWYWCGVFGELYGGAIESRFANDLQQVLSWIDGGEEPNTVVECNFAPTRLHTLKTRLSAAYKGLYAILMRDGGLDFLSGVPINVQTYFGARIDIHHIFPKDYCKKLGSGAHDYDSIINKAPISGDTNRIIGGNAPKIYLRKLIDKGTKEDRLDTILASHVIDATALKENDYETFFKLRREALLQRIENATGKKIARETAETIAQELKEEVYLEAEEEENVE
ncbi:MAG: DUF262 domain-containing protein [Dehalococcoidia bacterium]|nr:MAG: DUF262 domain-containing protein [Dehalococcoidia bacterium]